MADYYSGSWSWYSPKSDDVVKMYNSILKIHEGRIAKYDEHEIENLKNELSIVFINKCGELPSFELDENGYIIELKGEKVSEDTKNA
jgi:hypothetical protein